LPNAWRGSTRKGRLPVDWPRLRQAVLTACSFRCQWIEDGRRCPLPATDVDHIIAGDTHVLENLQGLCGKHHLLKTGREARALQLERKKLERLPEEQQPGIIDGPPTPTEHRGF
jgi:5-methylcytosine-specific restriction protein A